MDLHTKHVAFLFHPKIHPKKSSTLTDDGPGADVFKQEK